jgi:hypothetical protein
MVFKGCVHNSVHQEPIKGFGIRMASRSLDCLPGLGQVRCGVDVTKLFSLRENAIVKEPGSS